MSECLSEVVGGFNLGDVEGETVGVVDGITASSDLDTPLDCCDSSSTCFRDAVGVVGDDDRSEWP